ncbi:MAG: 3-phosphoglycerate dehydrogenase [Saprospiraceae bacterium]|nr:3-phosphoglycerate dehydrogenase [Saprospiraceae bacterium]
MRKILANDGIHAVGKKLLEEVGFEVVTEKISQENLAAHIGEFDGIMVRSATKIKAKDLVNPGRLKIIGRAGVGLDNIDSEFARTAGIEVFNTPSASSKAVASLVIAMLTGISRKLHHAARTMPLEGANNFANLKKMYAGGFELEGKKLGIIGFGRIGQELARMAVGLGMEIMPYDAFYTPTTLNCEFGKHSFSLPLQQYELDQVFEQADVISFHVPAQKDRALVGLSELNKMKNGVVLINTSRGGIIDEKALIEALDSGKVRAAGLDVFLNEPNPDAHILEHPGVFSTPHIGAETEEAQTRIGIELATRIIDFFEM